MFFDRVGSCRLVLTLEGSCSFRPERDGVHVRVSALVKFVLKPPLVMLVLACMCVVTFMRKPFDCVVMT